MAKLNLFGNITADVVEGGYAQGGGVSYSGVAARKLGAEVNVYSHGPGSHHYFDFLRQRAISTFSLSNDDTEGTFTIFDNEYDGTLRHQTCPYSGEMLTPADFARRGIALPENEVCVIASVMGEVGPELIRTLAERGNRLIGMPQGFFRIRDGANRVHAEPSLELLKVIHLFDTIIFSEEDIAGFDEGDGAEYVARLIDGVRTAIITKAEEGTTVHTLEGSTNGAKRTFHVPAYPLTDAEGAFIDSDDDIDAELRKAALTGLGDTFAAAAIIKRQEGQPLENALMFASVVAALKIREVSIEGGAGGIDGCLTIDEIAMRLGRDIMEGRLEHYFRATEGIREVGLPPQARL